MSEEWGRCPRSKRSLLGCANRRSEDTGPCCEVIPPGPNGFSIDYRDPGHWDIHAHGRRAFRIRGKPGDVVVHDERTDDARPFPRKPVPFRSVSAALAWCADELMDLSGPGGGFE